MFAVLSNLISKEFEKATGIKALSLKPYSKLDFPVSTHADMLLCVIENTVFSYEDYYYENIELFTKIKQYGYDIILVEKECSKMYPDDIALNVLVINKMIFCYAKHTAKEILNFAQKNKYKIVNVRQGYAACSTFIVDNHCVITGDAGIKSALENENIDVSLVSNDNIDLPGYNCGFIGGSGVTIDNKAYFFGKIKKHPDYDRIKSVFSNKQIEICEITTEKVCDFGGVKIFKQIN